MDYFYFVIQTAVFASLGLLAGCVVRIIIKQLQPGKKKNGEVTFIILILSSLIICVTTAVIKTGSLDIKSLIKSRYMTFHICLAVYFLLTSVFYRFLLIPSIVLYGMLFIVVSSNVKKYCQETDVPQSFNTSKSQNFTLKIVKLPDVIVCPVSRHYILNPDYDLSSAGTVQKWLFRDYQELQVSSPEDKAAIYSVILNSRNGRFEYSLRKEM